VYEACANGQQLKCRMVIDEFTRERLAIENFRREYNEIRPHSSLGQLTPSQFKQILSTTTGSKKASRSV
jgi:transposase InsO family protein